jgi:hypothetical protein
MEVSGQLQAPEGWVGPRTGLDVMEKTNSILAHARKRTQIIQLVGVAFMGIEFRICHIVLKGRSVLNQCC